MSPVTDGWDERRFSRMEDDISKLSQKVDSGQSTTASGLAAITAQITALQLSMPDHYVPRREYDTGLKSTVDSDKILEARIAKMEDNQSKAMWLVLGTLAATIGNIAVLAIKSLSGHV